ncbi:leucine-rich repeat-containing protein 15-like isoform X1 [Bradysia coprophila]|uniref:leucine-rich repeat-containing protein 15-like isoform X1 n=1 Tax=Bradysia coprophila TaxID=38358 RepID=UPI00187DB83B|nr:leucine-rich repeat-containing protein 15-like isoform X1 [Bradysia coprophila]
MESLTLSAIILFLMYTQVHGRMETVHCKISHYTCEVRIVEVDEPITAIIFDETPNTSVRELRITGRFESMPDLSDATTKFVNFKRLIIEEVGLKIVKRDRLAVFGKISEFELDLNKNEIAELDADIFKDLPNLKDILIRNDIQEMLPVNVFRNNKKLDFIMLSNNKLTEIHSDTFKELGNVYGLSMDYNQLDVLPANIFRDNKKLHNLNLSNNKLKEIDVDTFKELSDLTNIFLDSNQIEVLPNGLFDDNPKLKFITLSRNKLTEINVDTFKELPVLYNLDLSHNQIEVLPATIFRRNHNLNTIHFNDNKLRVIESDTFKGLNDLKFLELNDNQIEVLRKGLFDDNMEMKVVQLRDNKLMKIETELHKLKKLIYLHLAGNVCIDQSCAFPDCNSSSLLELIENVQQKCSNSNLLLHSN